MKKKINHLIILIILFFSGVLIGQEGVKNILFECTGVNLDVSKPGIKNVYISISKTPNHIIMHVKKDTTVFGDNLIDYWLDSLDFTDCKTKEDSTKVFRNNPFKLPPRTFIKEEVELTLEEFSKIVIAIEKIRLDRLKDLPEGTLVCGGRNFKIRYKSDKGIQEYYAWSPDVDTRKRRTFNFLEACKLILQVAGIRPSKLL